MCLSSTQPSFAALQFVPVQYGAPACVFGSHHPDVQAPHAHAASHGHATTQHGHSVSHGYPTNNHGNSVVHNQSAVSVVGQQPTSKGTFFPSSPNTATFPPTFGPDEKPVYTYASFYEEPVPELISNTLNNWRLYLPIAIPTDIINPTLTSLNYNIKYATTHDCGDATIQADVVLSIAGPSGGIVTGAAADVDGVYRPPRSSYGPWLPNSNATLSLSSKASVKKNNGGSSWSHFVEQATVAPKVSVIQAANLYLVLHVVEYPTAQTLRTLAVEVAASWCEDVAARKAKEAAEKKAREEAARKAKEEAERKAQEEAARKAKEEAERKAQEEAARKAKEEAERKAQEEAARKAKEEADRKAKEEADRKAQEEAVRKAKEEADRKAKEEADRIAQEEAARKAKEEADRKAQEEAARKAKEEADRKAKEEADRKAKEDAVKNAPPVADAKMQQNIAQAAKKHGVECPNGFGWTKTSWGYVCGGGGHKLTFQQLGMA